MDCCFLFFEHRKSIGKYGHGIQDSMLSEEVWNILESVFVLALTKSYMNIKDYYLIKDNEDFARIEGVFLDDKQVEKNFNLYLPNFMN